MGGDNEAVSDVRDRILTELEERKANIALIKDEEAGLFFERSRLDNPEYIDLAVSYQFVPYGADLFGLIRIPIEQKCVMHVFCGYIDDYFEVAQYLSSLLPI